MRVSWLFFNSLGPNLLTKVDNYSITLPFNQSKIYLYSLQYIITYYFNTNPMQEDLSQKQSYLYREIIDGGYSPAEFQEYIIAQNPQKGMDLTLWTMGELKRVTIKFKNEKDNEEEVEVKETKIEVQTQVQRSEKSQKLQRTQNSSKTIQKIEEISLNSKVQDFSKVIKCVKTNVKPLNENVVIKIDNYQKKEGGMFEKSYVIYQIKVEVLNSCVMRRYSDFEWLTQVLSIYYPGIPIPPIAHKGKMKRKQEKHFIKRMYILEKFLNKLLMIPDIRASELFIRFLTLKNQKDFESQKSKYKKIKAIQLNKLQNVEGQVQLKLDANTNTFLCKTQKYFKVAQPEVKRIYKDFKGAATMLENCAGYLKSIGNNCRTLNTGYVNYRKQNNLPVTKTNLYSMLQNMTYKYSTLLVQQAELFRKQVYSMVKYESFYMINISEHLQKLSRMQAQYISHKSTLRKKKQKLYDEGDMKKWQTTQKITTKPPRQQAIEIILPKQTNALLKQREIYALYNYQTYQQIQRNLRQNHNILATYMEEILKIQSDIASRQIMIWADMTMSVKGMTAVG